jgi:hypothetical protein
VGPREQVEKIALEHTRGFGGSLQQHVAPSSVHTPRAAPNIETTFGAGKPPDRPTGRGG